MTDPDPKADAPKKPGFMRRLFGGPLGTPDGAALRSEPVEREPATLEEVDLAAERVAMEAAPFAPAPFEPLPDPTPVGDEGATPPASVETQVPAAAPDASPLPPAAVGKAGPASRASWWSRLKQGLARSSSSIGQGIADVFTKRKLDAETLEDLDDLLIRADLGVATASRITAAIGKDRYEKAIDPEEVKAILAREVEAVLAPLAVPLDIDRAQKPFTILMIGVNGSGKTTTIGKLAAKFGAAGHAVMLAAGDTFRAAAVEQLKVWGARANAPVIVRDQGADAAGLAYDAFKQAQSAGTDILLVDTAGRLQNRTELMDELAKVIRVLRKLDPAAPHAVLLVLDATVGQNAMSQVESFGRVAGVTGLVMTKLDGTARGGILVAIAEKFRLPIHFIGVGEGVDDLEPFEARDFARAIAGLEEA